jgi:hypothetical protein
MDVLKFFKNLVDYIKTLKLRREAFLIDYVLQALAEPWHNEIGLHNISLLKAAMRTDFPVGN